MDDVKNDGFNREEILEMVKFLSQVDHKIAVACEMLGGDLAALTSDRALNAAQQASLHLTHVMYAICKRHGVEL